MSARAGSSGQSLQTLVDAVRRDQGAPPDRHHHISGPDVRPATQLPAPDRDNPNWKDR